MSDTENFHVDLHFFARPFTAMAYIAQAAFIGLLGVGCLILGLQWLEHGVYQLFLLMIPFSLCAFVVFSDVCILTRVSVENGVIYEYRKFVRRPKKLFSIDELKEVTAWRYGSKGRLSTVMSLDLRFKDASLDKNEEIILLPISTSKEEAKAFALKINQLIKTKGRSG